MSETNARVVTTRIPYRDTLEKLVPVLSTVYNYLVPMLLCTPNYLIASLIPPARIAPSLAFACAFVAHAALLGGGLFLEALRQQAWR